MRDETRSFIDSYGATSRESISFAWNGKHGADFQDANDKWRQEVIDAVLTEPDTAGPELITDLFEAEARWSKEAWCVRRTFSCLGSLMLNRSGVAKLDCFLDWFTMSFDTYSECHAMSITPRTLEAIISEVNKRLAVENNDMQKAKFDMASNLFMKLKSGSPLKCMVRVSPNDILQNRKQGKIKGIIRKILFWGKGTG